jgi:N utilization substance protein B
MAEKQQHERTEARRLATQVLYQGDILEIDPVTIISDERLVDETQLLSNYAKRLIEGTSANMDMIDDDIASASENWALDRMPIVDRSLLRMAAYEMRYVDEVPISVTINEAVNLAKEFGGDDSPRFVNGILGRIAIKLEEESHDTE